MKMAVSVYKYGRGGKCGYMCRYTYAGIYMQEKREIMLFIGNPMGRSIMRKHKGTKGSCTRAEGCTARSVEDSK